MPDTNVTRRVSVRQLDILYEFLNTHKDIATAYNRSLQAKTYSFRKWREIANVLNAVGDGVHKDYQGWCKYWTDFKSKIKKRVAAVRASHTRTGGGPSTAHSLTETELKFLGILGEGFGEGIRGVRVDPFAGPSGSIAAPLVEAQDSPASESILLSLNTAAVSVLEVQEPQLSESILHVPIVEIPVPSPARTRTPSPQQHPPSPAPAPAPAAAAAAAAQSPRRRRRRRDPPMSQEAARRALVQSSQMRAEAAVKSSLALERIAQNTEEMRDTILRIERALGGAFPRAGE